MSERALPPPLLAEHDFFARRLRRLNELQAEFEAITAEVETAWGEASERLGCQVYYDPEQRRFRERPGVPVQPVAQPKAEASEQPKAVPVPTPRNGVPELVSLGADDQ